MVSEESSSECPLTMILKKKKYQVSDNLTVQFRWHEIRISHCLTINNLHYGKTESKTSGSEWTK